jgi:N-ethylmaleimide reductase
VGVRLSPSGSFNSMSDSDPKATFSYAARELNRFGLAYLHVTEPIGSTPTPVAPVMRALFQGPFILNGGFTQETATAALAQGEADLISFGVLFLSNPDLVERFAEGVPLNTPDRATFYAGGEKGYIDYPTRERVATTV